MSTGVFFSHYCWFILEEELRSLQQLGWLGLIRVEKFSRPTKAQVNSLAPEREISPILCYLPTFSLDTLLILHKMNKTQLFSFFPMSLLSHSFRVSPNICLPPDSLAPQLSRLCGDFSYFFDWYGPSTFLVASCVYTSTIYHKNKALSLKCTPQQTNYQVTSSTEKTEICEFQPRSAVCFECSNRNYRLFLPSLSLFH